MKDGRPIPVRFPAAVEKRLRLHAIQHDMSLSDAIRSMVVRGFALTDESDANVSHPRRKILSRGVG